MTQAKAKITNTNQEAMLLIHAYVGRLASTVKEARRGRVDQRYSIGAAVLIGLQGDDGQFEPAYEVWGDTISNTGIGLLTTRSFEKGQQFYVMMRPSSGTKLFVIVRVRRCQRLTEGIYKVGGTFVYDDNRERYKWFR